jgi:sugar lactone lactonase YvrE
VYQYDGTGKFINFYGIDGNIKGPDGLTWGLGSDTNLYISDYKDNNIKRFWGPNPPPGKQAGENYPSFGNSGAIFATRTSFTKPRGLAFNSSNQELYVAGLETGVGAIDVFMSGGTFDKTFISNDGHLGVPYAFTWDAAGNFYVSDSPNNVVLKYDSTGKWLSNFANSGGLTTPYGVLFRGATDNLFVASNGTNDVRQFDKTSGASVPPVPVASGGGLTQPEYLLFG